jgi:hypothetical protein
MIVSIDRISTGDHGTFGVLSVDKQPVCVTLEDQWLNNKRGVSCIPEGVYVCYKHSGTKFKNVWEVRGVKDRTAILIHQGNTNTDTSGCILVGRMFAKFGQKHGVGRSVEALDMLRATLPDIFTIEILDNFDKAPSIFTQPKTLPWWRRLFKGE